MIRYNMIPTARRLVEQVVAIKPGENVLLLTDSDRPESITEAIAHAVSSAGGTLAILYMPPHQMGGIEPPPHVGAAIYGSNVVILQTSFDLDHTDAVREALRKGVRLVDMWGWVEEMMVVGGALADYDEVARVTKALSDIFRNAKEGRFTTPEGSDMTFSLDGRSCIPLFGFAQNKGEFTAYPDGEGAMSPVEGTAKGIMVNPFSIEHKELGFLTEPMRIEVKDGKVVSITGGVAAQRFWNLLDEYGDLAKNVAEFAVGTNPASRKRATMREAKKAWGTCHVAVGDSRSLGGKVTAPLHVDMIFDDPTVWADDEIVVKNGKIVD